MLIDGQRIFRNIQSETGFTYLRAVCYNDLRWVANLGVWQKVTFFASQSKLRFVPYTRASNKYHGYINSVI